MQNNNYQNQNYNNNQQGGQSSQVIDRGNVVVVVDKYPEKINGQVVLILGTQNPKMKKKWMTIGEATKWRQPDGSESTTEKIYLQPVVCLGTYYEQKTFWDSQRQQPAAQQTGGYQQQTGGYQQSGHR